MIMYQLSLPLMMNLNGSFSFSFYLSYLLIFLFTFFLRFLDFFSLSDELPDPNLSSFFKPANNA